ncbi:hypothetical protein ACWD00_00685 [Streptomyces viridiviolaceus]
MMSIRTFVATAFAATTLTLPTGAVAAPTATPADCASAQAAADQADDDFEAVKKDYLAQIADGGHPDASQRQALADADVERSTARAEAERICNSV